MYVYFYELIVCKKSGKFVEWIGLNRINFLNVDLCVYSLIVVDEFR